MKKLLSFLIIITLCSCSQNSENKISKINFKESLKISENTTVRFVMWGGSASINKWVDTYVTQEVLKRYKIKLIRIPADASIFVNKLLTEKKTGKNQGTMDLIWINGENFKNARENDLLFGPVAKALPNFKYMDEKTVEYDFGYPVDGYEIPYGRAQFVFEYDSMKVKDVPNSFSKLKKWVKKNPGKFTYPSPPDFTGSAFIRQVFYATAGGYKKYQGKFSSQKFNKNYKYMISYLKSIAPFTWNKGLNYPKDVAAMDTLFERGEVLINMTYHQANAQNKILQGRYPKTVKTFVMKEGSIFNTHFTAIPFNSTNKDGAMVVANFLLSPEAQLSKNNPKNWGDFTVLDINKLNKKDRKKFLKLKLGKATLSLNELASHGVPEISSEYLEKIEDSWSSSFSGKK